MEVSVQQVIDMTEKELFIKFCKMNKLMPFLMTKFYKKQPIAYKRLNGTYVEYKCNFDDYFYCDMGAAGKLVGNFTILDEQDQENYEDYIKNNPNCNYKNKNSTDKANWRREQVNLLISKFNN